MEVQVDRLVTKRRRVDTDCSKPPKLSARCKAIAARTSEIRVKAGTGLQAPRKIDSDEYGIYAFSANDVYENARTSVLQWSKVEDSVYDIVKEEVINALDNCRCVTLCNFWGKLPLGTEEEFPLVIKDSMTVTKLLGHGYLSFDKKGSSNLLEKETSTAEAKPKTGIRQQCRHQGLYRGRSALQQPPLQCIEQHNTEINSVQNNAPDPV
ncbi:hypothetical protein B0T24DRAFT_592575 [Lasiosphaeria ovina]|uniref:Uncharacterized protein n=1 Tax=Lasiosphaeria ovina TaxID=92902 RepID=A0AAE0NBW5_9PEZI|nr:hypothetical protein B0T24DRAFT_592575 [Lasiosphaeria ovina]